MSQIKNRQLFLERKSYRQRRLRDAMRMLPLLGVILWAIPLLWANDAKNADANSADAIIYIFGVWLFLIILCGLITRSLRPHQETE